MKLTESQAKSMGMVKDTAGNWVAKSASRLVESYGSNRGMAASRLHETDRRSRARTPAEVRLSIIDSAIATGLSLQESELFYDLGHRA
jgi:hypothetical protein